MDVIGTLNELLQAERAGVEVGAQLKAGQDKGYLRNHLAKVEADEAVSCAVLERAVRVMGGAPAAGKNDFAAKVAALPDLAAQLELLARGQMWVVKRLDLLLTEALPGEVTAALREMREEHVANVAWCNEEAARQRDGG